MRLRFVTPALYLGLALYVWIDFMRAPADGLANIGLMIATLPITAVGLFLTELMGGGSFVLLPSAFGYYADHAIYYWPSVVLIALFLYRIVAVLERRPD